jgi:hypothetical protein
MKKILSIIILTFIFFGTAAGEAETLLIYREEITNNEPRLSVLTKIENDNVIGYSLSNELFNSPYFIIELTKKNFENFREAFNRFLEWETIADENNLDSFTREIPVTVASDNIIWTCTSIRPVRNMNSMIFTFQFDWNPSRKEEYRALLNICSNIIEPLERGSSFTLQKNYMNNDEVSMFLDNISDEKIAFIIERQRERKTETERQRLLIDELFK